MAISKSANPYTMTLPDWCIKYENAIYVTLASGDLISGYTPATGDVLVYDTGSSEWDRYDASDLSNRVVKGVIYSYDSTAGETILLPVQIAYKYVKGIPKPPGMRQLQNWMEEGRAKAIDGKTVEPDGFSPSGAPSWLLVLGMI